MFSMRVPAEMRARWEEIAKREEMSTAAWVIARCEGPVAATLVPPVVNIAEIEMEVPGAPGVVLDLLTAAFGRNVAFTMANTLAGHPATPEETAALPVETKKKLLAAVGKLKRAQSEKKVKRAAAAESARASVQVPQRRGEMVDVKMPEPNLVAQCPHHHGYGEVCYKCDPKMGYPSIG